MSSPVQQRKLLAEARLFVPLVVLLWLGISLGIWLLVTPFAKAGTVGTNSPNGDPSGCPVDGQPPAPYYTEERWPGHGEGQAWSKNGWAVDEAMAGTWGMDPSMDYHAGGDPNRELIDVQPMDPNARNPFKNRRLKVLTNSDGSYSTCYVIKGDIVSSELWGDPEDRDWALRTGDEDMTYYIKLDRSDNEPEPPITNRERRNLQWWQPTGAKVSEILMESVQPDQHTLPPICMSKDWVYESLYNKSRRDTDPSNDLPESYNTVTDEKDCEPAVPALFQGALVYDVQHGYKETHPPRRQKDLRTGGQECRAWLEDCTGQWPPADFPGDVP